MDCPEYINSYVGMFCKTYEKSIDEYTVDFDDIKREAKIRFKRGERIVDRTLSFKEIEDCNSCDIVMDHVLVTMYIELMRDNEAY